MIDILGSGLVTNVLLFLIVVCNVYLIRLLIDLTNHSRYSFRYFSDWSNNVIEKLYEESPDIKEFMDPNLNNFLEKEFENKISKKSKNNLDL